ncbi:TPA: PefC/AfrB family outer membrane usher protein [Morganella morganii]|nr:PefC/AfrB family outer membrane usher protein [Morganella morganii]
MKTRKKPCLSFLALYVYSGLGVAEELNLDFIQGTNVVPSILKTNSAYPAGQYSVDVLVNKEYTGKTTIKISEIDEKNGELCFSPEWLNDAGVLLRNSAYNDVFDEQRKCYLLSREPHTNVDFDYNTQSLIFGIPQAYIPEKNDPVHWDYGVPGGRLRYNANFSKISDGYLSAFGNTELNLNVGRWVLSGNVNASRNSDESKITSSNLTLSTAVSQIQGDFLLGKSQTRTELFNDFGFYGVSLRSNSNMRPDKARGYAPDISGVATTSSRITVKQSGYTIYSRVIPAGPYRLDDLRPMGNGDLVVTVEDENGHKVETMYPVTTLPTLLRSGEFRYNVAMGEKDKNNDLKDAFPVHNLFVLGSLDYGFSTTTLNAAAIVHDKYQGAGLGVTHMLGPLGAVSFSTATSRASYDNGREKTGQSFSAKYAKNFSGRTDLQILTYRYQTEGYTEFADFEPRTTWFYGNQKSRYEGRLSHRFDSMYLSGTYWRQDYWRQRGYDEGGTISWSSALFDGSISVYLNGTYSRNAWSDKSDYSTSLGISVPFELGGRRYFSSSNAGYSRYGGTTFSTSASANITDRFYYSASVNSSSKGNKGGAVSASYTFDAMQTNLTLSESRTPYGKSQRTVMGNISGSILGTADSGLLFTKESSDTVGIVRIPDVEGVSVNGSMPTNKKGYTAVWLSGYSENNIKVNMNNVPDNVEFDITNWKVVPTEKAIVYREFGVEYVKRYILRIKGRDGKYFTGGTATTEQGLNAGFITRNGVLLMNMLAEPKTVSIDAGDGTICHFSVQGLKVNINKVQEVYCE